MVNKTVDHETKPATVKVDSQPYTFHLHFDGDRQYIDINGIDREVRIPSTDDKTDKLIKELGAHLDKGEKLTTQEAKFVTGLIKASRSGPTGP